MGNVARPNIQWRGAHPNNFTVGRPGAGRDGRNTFHHVVGSAESAVIVFNNPTRGASSHFVVTDQPGVIFQCVDLANTAWCDGNWESNLRTVAVEHHGDWRNGYNNPTVRENAAQLCAWLRDQGIINRPLRHRQVATNGTICPADLPVEAIWDRATQIINAANTPVDNRPEWLKNRVDVDDFTVYAQIEGLRLLNLNDVNQFADGRVFARNQNFLISSYVDIGGHRYLITKSSTDTNAAIGIREWETGRAPWTPPVVVEPPKPVTPKWYDSVIDDDNREMYVLRATQLVNLESGRPATDKTGKEIWYQAGDIIKDVSAHTIVSEVTYALTEYSYGQVKAGKPAVANGIKQSDLTIDATACPPGTPANPTPAPEPEDPIEPMPDVPNPVEDRLTALEKLVKLITDFLDKIFKSWR
jgi:hypothetical protein